MRKLKLALAIAGAMIAGVAIAAGLSTGNEFSTATPGKTVVGFVEMVWNASLGYAQPASSANPLPVTGSFSATLSGFTPGGTFATLTATNASGSVALPTGTTVAFQNTGTTTVSCTLGVGSATAAANEIIVQAASTVFVTPGTNTWGACIDQTGSTSNLVVLAGGSGLGTGFGGGGGSGGGGGAVTLGSGAVASGAYSAGAYAAGAVVAGAFLDGWDATQGTKADTAWTSGSGSVIALLKNIAGGVAGSIPAGSAIIGKVTTDQTTPGTTDLVHAAQQGTWTVQPGNTANTTPWLANPTSQYPSGAVPITASATGTTAATTATLAGTTGKTTYICSYSIRANATANANVQNSITGLISGTRTDQMWIPANTAGLGVDEQIFTPCIPASAANTAIAVASGAPGTGGQVTVNAAGYQQ